MQIAKVDDPRDLPAILALQKLAFQSEAERYNDFTIQPMLQTVEQIQEEWQSGKIFFKQTLGNQLVGSVRGKQDETGLCHIGRLIVHPDFRRQSLGTKLMHTIEEAFAGCREYRVFTGDKSFHAIALYEKLGYKIFDKKDNGSHYIVHMSKANTQEGDTN